FSRTARPPRPTPFPYTTLFRSAVYTGADLADAWAAPMPCAWPVTDDMKNPPHHPLAVGKACYAGDGVAAVVATSEAAARDAVDLDRKSTRLNSSHVKISYAVFC